MPRLSEIAADARALYGPLDQRPSAQEAGDGALWVDPEGGPALYLVRSGNWGRVGLAQRGAHDAAGGYGPGDLVTAAGGLYACTAPVPAADTRADTFDRPDQEGWGTASDGHVWTAVGGHGGASIVGGTGQMVADENGHYDALLLGEAFASPHIEVLVQWQITVNGDDAQEGIQIFLDTAADAPGTPEIDVSLGGIQSSGLPDSLGVQDGTSTLWPGASVGDLIVTRVRAGGCRLYARSWIDGDTEPATWQLIVQNGDGGGSGCGTLPAGSVGVQLRWGDPGNTLVVHAFSATTLAPAPAADPEHWTALAPAPAQAGVPVLYGPYVVDYTDIPHDGDRLVLWTPQVGDVLLRLFADYKTATNWDYGQLYVGQNLTDDPPTAQDVFATGLTGGGTNLVYQSLDNVADAAAGILAFGGGRANYNTAHVFSSTDPVQIQLAQVGENPDPGVGHVELYALIARAVAPL